jgi:hypothetical protein
MGDDRCVHMYAVEQILEAEVLVGGVLVIVVIHYRDGDDRSAQYLRKVVQRQAPA